MFCENERILDGISDDKLAGKAQEFSLMAGQGSAITKILAARMAGECLLRLKAQTKHGKFDEAKVLEGVSAATANRYMRLADSDYLSQCETFGELSGKLKSDSITSLRKVYSKIGLIKDKAENDSISKVVSSEGVEMCRFSGNYLVRLTLEGNRSMLGPRVEVSLGTSCPDEASKKRDFLFSSLHSMGVLSDRSLLKWQKNSKSVPDDSDNGLLSIVTALVGSAQESGVSDELGHSYVRAVEYLTAK
ncbi:MAG: hypothetical protein CL429_03220 [Acidimicrobiaceae bacterium]|nr:hypothetical protein [Acidimicrobiaceae bacterium]